MVVTVMLMLTVVVVVLPRLLLLLARSIVLALLPLGRAHTWMLVVTEVMLKLMLAVAVLQLQQERPGRGRRRTETCPAKRAPQKQQRLAGWLARAQGRGSATSRARQRGIWRTQSWWGFASP